MGKGIRRIILVICLMAFACTARAAECSHNYVTVEEPGTCTTPGVRYSECTLCGNTRDFENTEALGHAFGQWVTETEATCTREGLSARTCTRCDYREEQAIPSVDHSYETSSVSPDCDNRGYTLHTCSVCGDSFETDYIDALGHSYQTEVVEPTCTKDGYTLRSCGNCGDSEKLDHVEAVGHRYDEGVVTKEPTTTAMGRMTYTCMACGDSYTETIPRYVNPFEDVKEKDYFFTPVLWAVNNGITNGTDETHFSPNMKCTRAQVVTFLWRAMGEPEPAAQECPFVDVPENSYYEQAVLWASQSGITTGVDESHFAPNRVCTRAEVVTLLWRSRGKPMVEGTDRFSDVKQGAYYHDAVAWAVEKGITNGVDGGKFGPDQTCTRAQIVTFLYRDYQNS